MSRSSRILLMLGAALLLGATVARADELRPIQAQTITLGPITGVAYYTAEPDGDHLVATLSPTEGGTPLRVVAVLAAGQAMTLSVPRGVGEPAMSVEFRRRGDRLFVASSGFATN